MHALMEVFAEFMGYSFNNLVQCVRFGLVWFGKLDSFFLFFCWLGHKTSVQVVTPVCISVCKSHDIMLRQQKICNTFSTLYFAERNWKKMRTSITMNVFCTAASSKYWRMKIDLDFIWLLLVVTAYYFWQTFDAIIWQPCIPWKRHSQDFHYVSA